MAVLSGNGKRLLTLICKHDQQFAVDIPVSCKVISGLCTLIIIWELACAPG